MATVSSNRQAHAAGPGRHKVKGTVGLYLQVTGSAKSWVLRYVGPTGKRHDKGLGSLKHIDLRRAREKAEQARREKLDPSASNFETFAKERVRVETAQLTSTTHIREWSSSLERYVYPLIGKRPLASITVDDVYQCFAPIWDSRRQTASKTLQRVARIMAAAVVLKRHPGPNPATYAGNLSVLLPADKGKGAAIRNHHAAMPYTELPEFLQRLRSEGSIQSKLIEFVILTGARLGEARHAVWPEVDLESATWVVPAARTKTGAAHSVPLSTPAVELLKALPDQGEPVFGRIGHNTPLRLLWRMGHGPGSEQHATIHGFRSSLRDWLGDNDCPWEVAESVLAHTVGNAAARAYRRGDSLEQRRDWMQRWAEYCEK